jgi:hypothetical protein
LGHLLTGIIGFLEKYDGFKDPPETLPISFYDFEATAISNRVELSWNTASQSSIAAFEVERANVTNNKIDKFSNIESITARDNSIDNAYNTTDRNLNYGNVYAYRLRLIDIEGNFTYTDNKIVQIEEAQFGISEIVPNPVTSTSEFTITSEMDQYLHIVVYDLSGKELLVLKDGVLKSGSFKFEINSSILATGTYTLSIRNAQQTIVKQFSVVK